MEDCWYVLRDLARPNAKKPAYKQLQAMTELNGCVFVPLKQQVFRAFGRCVVRFVPYMRDLIFVPHHRWPSQRLRRTIDEQAGKQVQTLAHRPSGVQSLRSHSSGI